MGCVLAGCLFDSGWLTKGQRQQAAARRATPERLRATPEKAADQPAAGAPAARALKIRAYASARFAAEVPKSRQWIAELVARAGAVLEPTLEVRLQLTEIRPWRPQAGEDDMTAVLNELMDLDSGEDVDWVAGFLPAVPRLELSLDKLGESALLGKHFVMRAMHDASEYDAINTHFDELDEEARRSLYRTRLKHKATAVFLHEIGHTLGALHEHEQKTLMRPRYDPKAQGYSRAAVGLMRLTLAHRLDPAQPSTQTLAQKVIAYLEDTAASWLSQERQAAIERLKVLAAPTPAQQHAAEKLAGVPAGSLAPGDAQKLTEALEHEAAGRAQQAWGSAEPLFERYLEIYEVQDLRCRLAMRRAGRWKEVDAHCKPLMAIVEQRTEKAGSPPQPKP